ncbi:MAG TPA: hypothetical protein VM101_03460 [Flavitalea sp.]|nr:hypothetical protein [Flavitalea sp.]
MKNILITIYLLTTAHVLSAQTLDSIFFNLYTDSLKKGTHNYINVEGHFSDGTYLPLGNKELKFSSSGGKFNGNSLFIDTSFTDDKVKVKVAVIRNPRLSREIEIYIKKSADNEKLPTIDEVMHSGRDSAAGRKRKRK